MERMTKLAKDLSTGKSYIISPKIMEYEDKTLPSDNLKPKTADVSTTFSSMNIFDLMHNVETYGIDYVADKCEKEHKKNIISIFNKMNVYDVKIEQSDDSYVVTYPSNAKINHNLFNEYQSTFDLQRKDMYRDICETGKAYIRVYEDIYNSPYLSHDKTDDFAIDRLFVDFDMPTIPAESYHLIIEYGGKKYTQKKLANYINELNLVTHIDGNKKLDLIQKTHNELFETISYLRNLYLP